MSLRSCRSLVMRDYRRLRDKRNVKSVLLDCKEGRTHRLQHGSDVCIFLEFLLCLDPIITR